MLVIGHPSLGEHDFIVFLDLLSSVLSVLDLMIMSGSASLSSYSRTRWTLHSRSQTTDGLWNDYVLTKPGHSSTYSVDS